MNHGKPTSAALRRLMSPKTSASGSIHKVRTSFTVVATASASSPYFAAAPTTELVSWIATAAHRPKALWLRPMKCPSKGKMKSPTAVREKKIPRRGRHGAAVGLDGAADGGEGAAAANRCPRRDQQRSGAVDAQQAPEVPTCDHDCRDAYGRNV